MDDTWWVTPTDLDEAQRAVVALPAQGSYLVVGPPGSGKSNLLLLRANHLSLGAAPNIAVIVFTRTLERFLARGGDDYSFDQSCIYTSTRWQLQFLERFGVEVGEDDDFDRFRKKIVVEMTRVLDTRTIPPQHQVILLDEAQDYWPEEIDVFRRLSDNLFAVADSRQKIYPGKSGIDALKAIAGKPRVLPFHYRNGRKICAVADELGKRFDDYQPILPSAQYNETNLPSSVEVVACGGIDDQVTRLVATITTQLKAYPRGMIGVLVPRGADLGAVWALLAQTPVGNVASLHTAATDASFADGKRVCVTTVHSAKGLEFRAVNVVCCEGFKKFSEQRAMTYVAVTRAKSSLVLFHEEKLAGYLSEAIRPAIGSKSTPTLADAFGGKLRKGK